MPGPFLRFFRRNARVRVTAAGQTVELGRLNKTLVDSEMNGMVIIGARFGDRSEGKEAVVFVQGRREALPRVHEERVGFLRSALRKQAGK
jgi:hypothetical protein